MELYLFVIFILITCSFVRGKKVKTVCFYVCCMILLYIACFRDASVGFDHKSYIDASLGKELRDEDKAKIEIVWGWLNYVFARINIGPVFTIVTSLLSMVPLFAFVKKESKNSVFSLLLFILIPYGFCFFLTGIRQSLAAGIVVWAYYYLMNRKYIIASVLSILAIGIHASAFFVLLFLPIFFVDVKKMVFYALLAGSALIGFTFRYSIFDIFEVISPYVGFLSFYEGYGAYHVDDIMNTSGLLSVIVPPTVFAFLSVKYDSTNDFYTKLFCCGVIGTNFFANVPMIGRYFMYFTILQLVLVPNVFRKSTYLFKAGILLTIVYMMLYFYLFIPEATGTLKFKFFI